ncbi:hypothetical protein RUND412_001687 [Rhizina undulata]
MTPEEARVAIRAHLSSTGCEYYVMLRTYPENSTPEETGYVKYRLALDPSLQFDVGSTKVDSLEYDQAVAIAKLLEERNARTEADGEWVLSGLRMAVGSEKFGLLINFRRYSDRDDLVDSQRNNSARNAVENTPDDSAEASEEISVTPSENVQTEIPRNLIQQPDPIYSEMDLAREVVGNAPMDTANFSEETAINTSTEEVEPEISRIAIQQPDPFDSELDSTVGRRSPTPTSDLGSGASTPVPSTIRTEKEIQIDDLDRIEDVACKLSELLGGSISSISMLKGVLEARKLLMGEEHFRTFITMGNLGYWYRQYGWRNEGMVLLQKTVDGLKRVLGQRNEDTLNAMYKLAEAKFSQNIFGEAWWLFEMVLEGQVEILGKNHQATLDTMKQLERVYSYYYCSLGLFDDGLKLLESLVKCQILVRGCEDHPHTVVAMDLLVNHHARWSKNIGAHACLKNMVKRRIPALAVEDAYGNNEAQYVFGGIDSNAPNSNPCRPFYNA